MDIDDIEDQKEVKNSRCTGHLKLLSETDLEGYLQLRDRFHTEVANAKRGEKVEMFNKRLKIIKEYVVKHDENDWKRSFATGVIFLENSIAINIKQLILLMGKCKSSINGSLHQLGYIARPASKETDEQIILSIPIFNRDRRELKKWTIRQKRNARRRQNAKPKSPIETEPTPEEPETVVEEKREQPVLAKTAEDVWAKTINFPVPAKFRYKMFNSYFQSIPIVAQI
ncbi:hypothetical protein TVAG_317010 [Trichomonas vaginalis G3]|uniref:Initiator binding domain-containing protein n=1 Tax=Trichomonas vaginalis (strain ATCC PRA-98 / G3) TaxID=412133 RepID=A2F077_TRIV3|nr:transcription-initiator DNA-binding domain ibd family [Trichomonas vaginalis G3]EAY01712.1 hypothetical protein TVAG_317010 [Trichomonas vaginalis G3]KAI5489644.1 transcription-initiator DNA-binding domain ibd family [Trichomonas vaginalis G3]|eukprot:XP_001330408.1 hypothetical protein [Trichomonas vaginalis G3]